MKKPKILVATRSRHVYDVFRMQLGEYFGDSVELFDGATVDLECNPDLILTSYREILKEHRFPLDKLIVARRTVDISTIGDLMSLPAGTKCLVVNNSHDTAMETILCLQNLGLELDLYPYNPDLGLPAENIQIAIVGKTGEEFVPPCMKRVIYIEIRPIDYATILEIAFRLNIETSNSQVYSSTYIRQIVKLTGELSNSLENERGLNRQMDAIFNTVHDGIIAITKRSDILQANHAAYKILGMQSASANLLGKKIDDVFPGLSFDTSTRESIIHQFGEMYLVMNWTDLEQGHLGSVIAFQDVTRLQRLEQDFRKRLQVKGLTSRYSEDDIIGCSTAIVKSRSILEKIAKVNRTVVILGESGTGKELFAHAIHNLSDRRGGPFLPVNFAGLPESLAESELFGYEDGAFTGARKGGKAGLFELAHNGTIFLDEIGDASPAIQALLLRVLQERQIMRVGGDRVIPIDVRVVAATNRDLKQLVQEGKFRHDLYYRLFVLPLYIPSLRERRDDIPLLIHHFLQKSSARKFIVPEVVMNRLISYDWPGNIRELEAAVQYIVSVAEKDEVTLDDLPHHFWDEPHVLRSTGAIAEQLSEHGDLMIFRVILQCLKWYREQGTQSVGRNVIVEYANKQGIFTTEQQVRSRMAILQQFGLMEIGRRRQGSRITAEGEHVLQQIDELRGISASYGWG